MSLRDYNANEFDQILGKGVIKLSLIWNRYPDIESVITYATVPANIYVFIYFDYSDGLCTSPIHSPVGKIELLCA